MGVVGQAGTLFSAVFFWGLLGPLALVMEVQGGFFADPTMLACGQGNLQLTLPPGWEKNASLVLTTWDTEGKAHAVQNDSSCGLWVSGTPDGSRKVFISYTGCYVFEWEGNYFMLVGIEGTDAAGQKVLHEEKLLRCPVDLPALDAPSSSVCSAVDSQDRLPSRWGKRSAEHHLQEGISHVASKGPVILLQDQLRRETAMDGLGAAVHAAAPWALGFAAVATGALLCAVLLAAVLWQRKAPVIHEINVLQ
nr:PREDICTED: zona pellucida sperm-binding protein 4-like [Apteryx mantelli mantelli]